MSVMCWSPWVIANISGYVICHPVCVFVCPSVSVSVCLPLPVSLTCFFFCSASDSVCLWVSLVCLDSSSVSVGLPQLPACLTSNNWGDWFVNVWIDTFASFLALLTSSYTYVIYIAPTIVRAVSLFKRCLNGNVLRYVLAYSHVPACMIVVSCR